MGDYTNDNTKIGTCGQGYYATKAMLETLKHDTTEEDVQYYLDPSKSCSFAFPFPEYDGKKIGEISNFHEGERVDFFFDVPASTPTFHRQISQHIHPRGGDGINLFCNCPHDGGAVSNNFDKHSVRFRLNEQHYYKGGLVIKAECIYCKEPNIFSKDEAAIICEWIESRKHSEEADKSYYMEISKRIKETYNY